MKSLSLKSLSYAYDPSGSAGFRLEDISLEISGGMRVGILGPNGSGKSTIIRLLLKILSPPTGMMLYDQRDIADIPQKDLAQLVSYVPQMAASQYAYAAEDIIAMGRYPHGTRLFYRPGKGDREIVEDIIKRLDLAQLRYRPVTTLSGGEYQRVLLGRAFVQRTPLILLDEPTNHLDLRHQLNLLEMIAEEQRRRELTVISVFHDINLAMGFADRLLLLDGGRMAAWDTPRKLAGSPILEHVYRLRFRSLINPFNEAPHLVAGQALAGEL
ncbi:ABC transporter ATP-binding protein [Salinispira pacifica]|uniref:ABC transporter (Iron.B12.siderophore.hemin), ATP-binding component n=1 Tax=Salinispira pacifica TaxID=1307761 RepID=V5WIN7_9SPIO|nr:ABC transporter ATP-binding protein [Salinispira pacifica]AHC15429.1 ABC transporter (iron.B12.siderophore.hemin), ATP-binding component [Salinispira pacifica]